MWGRRQGSGSHGEGTGLGARARGKVSVRRFLLLPVCSRGQDALLWQRKGEAERSGQHPASTAGSSAGSRSGQEGPSPLGAPGVCRALSLEWPPGWGRGE